MPQGHNEEVMHLAVGRQQHWETFFEKSDTRAESKASKEVSEQKVFQSGVTAQILKRVGRCHPKKTARNSRAGAHDVQRECGDSRGKVWGRTILKIRPKEFTVYPKMKKSH